MSAQPTIPIVVLSQRPVIEKAVRQELKALQRQVDDLHVYESVEDAMAGLKSLNEAVVVLDWELGVKPVNDFMQGLRREEKDHFIEIFLIAAEPSDKIIAYGAEFGVGQVFTGEVNAVKMRVVLTKLTEKLQQQAPLREIKKKLATLRQNNEWASVVALLEKLHDQDQANKEIIMQLAEAYFYTQEYQKAHDILLPLMKENPVPIRAKHWLGKILLKLGKPQKATDLLKEAKLLNPYNIDRLIMLGHTLLGLNKADEAKEVFAEAQNYDPDNLDIIKGRGTSALVDGEVNEALDVLQGHLDGRGLASVFNTAAVLAMRLQSFDKGMRLYEAAEKALEDDKSILARLSYNKGIGYYKWKKVNEAKQCFEQALKYDPTFDNARHNLEVLDKKASSLSSFESSKEVQPSQKEYEVSSGDALESTASPDDFELDVREENIDFTNDSFELGFDDSLDDALDDLDMDD